MAKKKLTKNYNQSLKEFLKSPPKTQHRSKIKTGKMKRVKTGH